MTANSGRTSTISPVPAITQGRIPSSAISRARLRRANGALGIRRLARSPELRAAALWVVPIVLIGAIYFSPKHLLTPDKAVAFLLALGVVVLAARAPGRSLIVLVVLLPFQGLLLAELFTLHAPELIVRYLAAWKETLALGVILAGARSFIASGRRADTLDRLALAFVALTALYALLQEHLIPGSPTQTSIRLLGFRETAGFVLVLLGARHAPLGRDFAQRAGRAVLAVGVLVSAVAIFEAISPSSWNHFVVDTIGYPRYQEIVLNGHVSDPNNILSYAYLGGSQFVRVGSVFLDPLSLAWYLILPFAVAFERAVRRQSSLPNTTALLLIVAALLLTQTRSAIFGAAITAALAYRPAAGRGRHWRTQLGILLVGLAVVVAPAAIGTGAVKRIQQIANKANPDTAGHFRGFSQGLNRLEALPLGLGLGTTAGTGQRFHVAGDVIAENNYLEVGDELGIAGAVLFVALTIALIMWLRRAGRTDPEPLIAAAWTAAVGLAVSAWFLQTWSVFAVAWTYWGIAGATLCIARQHAAARAAAPAPVDAKTAPVQRPILTASR